MASARHGVAMKYAERPGSSMASEVTSSRHMEMSESYQTSTMGVRPVSEAEPISVIASTGTSTAAR